MGIVVRGRRGDRDLFEGHGQHSFWAFLVLVFHKRWKIHHDYKVASLSSSNWASMVDRSPADRGVDVINREAVA